MSPPEEVTLPGTHSVELTPRAGGAPFRLLLAPSPEETPPGGFPVLYLLDGGAFFGTLVEMLRMRRNRPAMTGVGAAMIVGVAHPGVFPYDRERREGEFGPAGRDALLRFLLDDLHPYIEANFPVNPEHRVLLGHSLAGGFVLHALLENPDAYRSFVAISPSLWMDRDGYRRGLGTLAERVPALASIPSVMVAVGEYDQAIAPWQREAPDQERFRRIREERRMVDDARDFAEELSQVLGNPDRVHFEVCEGEDHSSVVPRALSRSLRFSIPRAPESASPRT